MNKEKSLLFKYQRALENIAYPEVVTPNEADDWAYWLDIKETAKVKLIIKMIKTAKEALGRI